MSFLLKSIPPKSKEKDTPSSADATAEKNRVAEDPFVNWDIWPEEATRRDIDSAGIKASIDMLKSKIQTTLENCPDFVDALPSGSIHTYHYPFVDGKVSFPHGESVYEVLIGKDTTTPYHIINIYRATTRKRRYRDELEINERNNTIDYTRYSTNGAKRQATNNQFALMQIHKILNSLSTHPALPQSS